MGSNEAAKFLMGVVTNVWLPPALVVAVRLGLAERLAEGPATADTLAKAIGAHADSVRRVLNALSSVGVFERFGDDRFGPTEISDLLRADHPRQLGPLIDLVLSGENYQAWGRLEDAVRTGRCAFDICHGQSWVEYLDAHPDRREVFAAGMTASTRATEGAVLAAHDFGQFTRAVDIGGSQASLIGRLLERYPDARGIVFDLPGTVEDGRRHWAGAPFADRLDAVGGNFFESVPEGDLYLLKLILHDWQDPEALTILKSIRRAIWHGGRVAIIETILPDDGSRHIGWGLDVAMMATTGGRERTRQELQALLRAAGFEATGFTPTPVMYSVLEGKAV